MVNEGDQRPNIVMIVADDHGREAVGCYGNPVVSTPTSIALPLPGSGSTMPFALPHRVARAGR